MHTQISKLFFSLIIIAVSLFTYLFVFETKVYDALSQEDHIIEYLSSLFLLLSSVIFLKVIFYSRNHNLTNGKWVTVLFIAVSTLFFLAAGE